MPAADRDLRRLLRGEQENTRPEPPRSSNVIAREINNIARKFVLTVAALEKPPARVASEHDVT